MSATPPDSGEHEVCWCGKPSGHKVAPVRSPQRASVSLPLSLAQRILASLERGDIFQREMASELRGRLPK